MSKAKDEVKQLLLDQYQELEKLIKTTDNLNIQIAEYIDECIFGEDDLLDKYERENRQLDELEHLDLRDLQHEHKEILISILS